MYGLSTVSFMSVVAYLLHVFIVYISLCFYECLFLICKVFLKHNDYVHMLGTPLRFKSYFYKIYLYYKHSIIAFISVNILLCQNYL